MIWPEKHRYSVRATGLERMALDAVEACSNAFEASNTNAFMVWLTAFFLLFIFADTVIAAAILRSKL